MRDHSSALEIPPLRVSLLLAFREHRLSLILTALFAAAALILNVLRPGTFDLRGLIFWPSTMSFAVAVCYIVACAVTWHRWRDRPADGWNSGLQGWRDTWLRALAGAMPPARLARLVAVSVVLPLLMNTFGVWKRAIPSWGGFRAEVTVAAADQWLHGGHQPWALLQPYLGSPAITASLDWLYYTWLPLFVVVAVWQAGWREPSWERERFFATLAISWFGIGVVAATFGASAGPIFADLVPGQRSQFQGMLEYLRGVSGHHELTTLVMRDFLWRASHEPIDNPYVGISAFPSMHIAMVTLYVCSLWRSHRRLAMLATFYAVMTFLGSVHLGWHYAVDGEAASLGTVTIWWVTGRFFRHGVRD